MTHFLRKTLVQVGTIQTATQITTEGVVGLDVEFSIDRSLARKPNTAVVKLYNLNDTSRGAIHAQRHYPVTVKCAHGDNALTMIFSGDLRKATTKREGSDIITEIEAGDHERASQENRASVSFGRNAKVRDVIIALIEAAGGSANDVPASLTTLANGSATFAGAVAVTGQATAELGRLAESCGYELSYQDGRPQLLARGAASERTAAYLSYDTGLLSAPVRDNKGKVSARCLIIPDLIPGRQVQFAASVSVDLGGGVLARSGDVDGQFRIESVRYTGSTFGAEWYADLVCKEV